MLDRRVPCFPSTHDTHTNVCWTNLSKNAILTAGCRQNDLGRISERIIMACDAIHRAYASLAGWLREFVHDDRHRRTQSYCSFVTTAIAEASSSTTRILLQRTFLCPSCYVAPCKKPHIRVTHYEYLLGTARYVQRFEFGSMQFHEKGWGKLS